jgi:Restriction endonuclease fold toxin 7
MIGGGCSGTPQFLPPVAAIEEAGAAAISAAARLAANAAAGREFEQAGLKALNAAKNTTTINVPGIATGSIPDVLNAGLTEFKSAVEINNSLQLRIQTAYASLTGQPLNLVVGPATERVSQSLQQAIASTGGTIQRFNPATGIFTPFP